jgi:hypothetical protein
MYSVRSDQTCEHSARAKRERMRGEGWSPSPYRGPTPSPPKLGVATFKFNLPCSLVYTKNRMQVVQNEGVGVSEF